MYVINKFSVNCQSLKLISANMSVTPKTLNIFSANISRFTVFSEWLSLWKPTCKMPLICWWERWWFSGPFPYLHHSPSLSGTNVWTKWGWKCHWWVCTEIGFVICVCICVYAIGDWLNKGPTSIPEHFKCSSAGKVVVTFMRKKYS